MSFGNNYGQYDGEECRRRIDTDTFCDGVIVCEEDICCCPECGWEGDCDE